MSATIHAPITLARDAYQLAMVELLKGGTLPADLPTRVAWLASLKAVPPVLELDEPPVSGPVGATVGILNQDAIVAGTDCYKCVATNPIKWVRLNDTLDSAAITAALGHTPADDAAVVKHVSQPLDASARLENDAEIEAVSDGFLLVRKNQGNTRHVSFSLFRLWSWIKSNLNGTLTLAGTKTFTGQLELTGQAATNGTSAMTRDLVRSERALLDVYDDWWLYGSYGCMISGGVNGTGTYASNAGAHAGSAIGGWARLILSSFTTRPSGTGNDQGLCAVPLAVALFGSFSALNTTSVIRLIVGDALSGTPDLSTANPLADKGFGVEWYMSGATRMVRLFTHNGTTFNYGSGQQWYGYWVGQAAIVLASNGAGAVNLYHAGSDAHVALGKPTLQSALSMTTGPTSGVYGRAGAVTLVAVGNGSAVPSAFVSVIRARMMLNHPI